jgi:hypothetical protein
MTAVVGTMTAVLVANRPPAVAPEDQLKLDAIAAKCRQWTIGPGLGGDAMSKAYLDQGGNRYLYAMSNREEGGKFLQYEEQNYGINLGWTDRADAETQRRVTRWFFARENGVGKPFTYGERIALAYGGGRSFLKYEGRPFGINLDWSNPPVYEWEIYGGALGTPVQLGHEVAIYNAKVAEFFVAFDRNFGADIGWADSRRWEAQLGDWLEDMLREYGDDIVKSALVAALSLI